MAKRLTYTPVARVADTRGNTTQIRVRSENGAERTISLDRAVELVENGQMNGYFVNVSVARRAFIQARPSARAPRLLNLPVAE